MKKYVLSLIIFGIILTGYGLGEDDFVYDPKGKRDPFIPLVTAEGYIIKLEEEISEIRVEGIIYTPKGLSYAIVNGTVVKEGENLDSIRILKIEKDKIFILKDGKKMSIELRREE